MNRLVLLALTLTVIAGCARTTEGVRVATFTTLTRPTASPNPALLDAHCPFGIPQKLPSLDHGPTVVVTREAYALEHDSLSKIALWVCASLDSDLVFGDAKRKNNWKPDPDLPSGTAAVEGTIKGPASIVAI